MGPILLLGNLLQPVLDMEVQKELVLLGIKNGLDTSETGPMKVDIGPNAHPQILNEVLTDGANIPSHLMIFFAGMLCFTIRISNNKHLPLR